jgi:hypothetical protein
MDEIRMGPGNFNSTEGFARCPPGGKVLTGGISGSDLKYVDITLNQPFPDGKTWVGEGTRRAGAPAGALVPLTVWAICVDVPDPAPPE